MPRIAFDTLEHLNRPSQFAIMEKVTDVLATSPAVTHLLVRGSIARGTSDRLSDVDLVIGITPSAYADFVAVHDALAATELGAIVPGWLDTIVPRMGGLGYVHLIEHAGRLYQLDLYLAPADRLTSIAAFTSGSIVYTNPDAGIHLYDPANDDFINRHLSAAPTCEQLIVEALVLTWMIHKRLMRGQQFMAYAETHMLHTAARSLIRTALSPQTAFYGWYHLDTDLGKTPIGQACLRELDMLIASPPVPTVRSLTDSLERILALAHRAAPQAVDKLCLSIDAYRHHLALD
ncbi:hypothetical protein IMZ11_31255 [Microtetraspora sp. AC03309]|uniref:hypothetical protein n=1 Tax=Microtetraspora sp. AC03309 TaxID=2779376 RepID=UPI001E35F6CF|nr:hypothetical protein [Microtetraspora sp. AC03309]MCC5580112.1 hypothetical protein [Microtetraspora sp. AC03309]